MEELGVKALSILVDNLQKGAEVMPAYVQDLLERYVQYKTYWFWVWIWICGIVLMVMLITAIYWYKEDEWWWFIWCFWFLVWLWILWCLIYGLFQINYVPELYLINDLMWYWCHCK